MLEKRLPARPPLQPAGGLLPPPTPPRQRGSRRAARPGPAPELGAGGGGVCRGPAAALGGELPLCARPFLSTSRFYALQRTSKPKPAPGSLGSVRAPRAGGGSKGSFKAGSSALHPLRLRASALLYLLCARKTRICPSEPSPSSPALFFTSVAVKMKYFNTSFLSLKSCYQTGLS